MINWNYINLLAGLLIGLALSCFFILRQNSKKCVTMINKMHSSVTTSDVQATLTPSQILELLKEGNQRFINNTPINKNFPLQIAATLKSQHPLAVMLSCIDSRVPVELIFDLSVGDAFVIRVAGNILNEDILASIEFACHVARAKVIVVLGHENCGAIKAACDHLCFGHIHHLIEKIEPAIKLASNDTGHIDNDNPQFISDVMSHNVELVKKQIYERSQILRNLIDGGNVGLVGAIYDIATGKITFKNSTHLNH